MEQRRAELGTQLAETEQRLRRQREELAQVTERLARDRRTLEAAPVSGGDAPPLPGSGFGPEGGPGSR